MRRGKIRCYGMTEHIHITKLVTNHSRHLITLFPDRDLPPPCVYPSRYRCWWVPTKHHLLTRIGLVPRTMLPGGTEFLEPGPDLVLGPRECSWSGLYPIKYQHLQKFYSETDLLHRSAGRRISCFRGCVRQQYVETVRLCRRVSVHLRHQGECKMTEVKNKREVPMHLKTETTTLQRLSKSNNI